MNKYPNVKFQPSLDRYPEMIWPEGLDKFLAAQLLDACYVRIDTEIQNQYICNELRDLVSFYRQWYQPGYGSYGMSIPFRNEQGGAIAHGQIAKTVELLTDAIDAALAIRDENGNLLRAGIIQRSGVTGWVAYLHNPDAYYSTLYDAYMSDVAWRYASNESFHYKSFWVMRDERAYRLSWIKEMIGDLSK